MIGLIEINSPDYLLVADKPISAGEHVVIQRLSCAAIKERFKDFEYCENILKKESDVFNPFVEQNMQYEDDFKAIVSTVKHRLEHPLNDKLVVCHIDDEVGEGVFAKERIEPGIVCVYAGQLEKAEVSSCYGVGIGPLHNDLRINAENVGGIARFIQHMPQSVDALFQAIDRANIDDFLKMIAVYDIVLSPEVMSVLDLCLDEVKSQAKEQIMRVMEKQGLLSTELKRKPFLGAVSSKLATANTRFHSIFIDNIPYVYVEAIRPIEVGEQLGIPYGDDWWGSKQQVPRYFDKNTGYTIPQTDYLLALEPILLQYKTDNKELALRRASHFNHLDNVKTLLEYDAKPNDISPSGKTALMIVGDGVKLKDSQALVITASIKAALKEYGAREAHVAEIALSAAGSVLLFSVNKTVEVSNLADKTSSLEFK